MVTKCILTVCFKVFFWIWLGLSVSRLFYAQSVGLFIHWVSQSIIQAVLRKGCTFPYIQLFGVQFNFGSCCSCWYVLCCVDPVGSNRFLINNYFSFYCWELFFFLELIGFNWFLRFFTYCFETGITGNGWCRLEVWWLLQRSVFL